MTTDIDREFALHTREQKNARSRVLYKLKEKNIISSDRVQRGKYHVLDHSLCFIAPDENEQELYPISLPLGLDSLVNIPPKSVIVVAGTSNAGKTALLLSIAARNLETHAGGLLYLMSEMGSGEFKTRLKRFEGVLYEQWFKGMKSAERSTGYFAAIKKYNPDGISFVDYLEDANGEFFKIPSAIREIYDALGNGVAVIAIQKATGATFGRGNEGTSEKARLYLTMDKLAEVDRSVVCAVKILKAKDYKDRNPNGLELHAKVNAARIAPFTEWRRWDPKDRERAVEQYKVTRGGAR